MIEVLGIALLVVTAVGVPVAYCVGRLVRRDTLNATYHEGWRDGSATARQGSVLGVGEGNVHGD
jgi:hypothetical protein